MLRCVFAAALIAVPMIAVTPAAQAARSLDDVLARLEAIEKENANLRKRVQRLEAAERERPVMASLPASAPRTASVERAVAPAVAAIQPAAGQAFAAVPAIEPGRNWTGLYLGASAGLRRAEHSWRTNSMLGGFVANAPNSEDFGDNTGRFGGFIGVNFQGNSKIVVGIEADLAYGKTKAETNHTIPGTLVGPFLLSVGEPRDSSQFKTEWDASLRGRIGALITPDTLAYLTGGVAWQRVEATASCEPAFGFFAPFPVCVLHSHTDTQKKTLAGWTFGAGIETALAAYWTGRIEYRYASFRDFNHIFIAEDCCDGNLNTTISLATHTLTFGLAYKFGGL